MDFLEGLGRQTFQLKEKKKVKSCLFPKKSYNVESTTFRKRWRKRARAFSLTLIGSPLHPL
jgi:hypothetical protein